MTAETNTARTGITYRTVDAAKFLALHNSGATARVIAEQLGVTARTVVRHRAKHGLSQPSPGNTFRVTPEWKAKVEQMLTDGASIAETARTMGCNYLTINRHFPGRGWAKKQSGTYANAVRRGNRELARLGLGRMQSLTQTPTKEAA